MYLDHSSEISFPSTINVTGQDIDISFINKEQQDFYKKLFVELVELYVSSDHPRLIVGLAGATGSGKSVIAALFQEFSKQVALPFRFQTLGIDAFHYRNNFLETHTDNTGETLKNRKGRHDTYDVPMLIQALKEFKTGETISLPEYSRRIHDPIEGVITISEKRAILFVEGLWLFYEHDKWKEVLPLIDYRIFIEADKERVMEAVVKRHQKGGRSKEDANRYYDTVDAVNFEQVSVTKNKADKIIPAYYAIGQGE